MDFLIVDTSHMICEVSSFFSLGTASNCERTDIETFCG